MTDCPHLLTNENDRCVECGEVVMNPVYSKEDFANELEKTFGIRFITVKVPTADTTVKLAKLLASTLDEYKTLVEENQDPNDPSLPKIQFVGNTITRIPFKMIWNNLVADSYVKAVAIGYRSPLFRWENLLLGGAASEN